MHTRVVSFSKESQSEICAWIVRNEFKSSGNDCCCSLSLLLVSSVARVRDLRVSRVYFTGSFASRQFYRLLTVSGKFIKGDLFGLLNQCTSDSCSFNIGWTSKTAVQNSM